MYEPYTRQSLPSKCYREWLGTAICVFNSNNAFVIENFLNEPVEQTWHQLINKTSGKLLKRVKNRFEKRGATRVPELFDELIEETGLSTVSGLRILMGSRYWPQEKDSLVDSLL